jgi:hypothetical protein
MPIPADLFGYNANPRATAAWASRAGNTIFSLAAPEIVKGAGRGKMAFPYRAIEKLTGQPLKCHEQTIGDCVSHGVAMVLKILAAIEILAGDEEEYREISTEAIYALSRVQVGKGAIGTSDGSVGAWAAEAVQKFGVLPRDIYPRDSRNSWDLTAYSGDLAREWGMPRRGLPAKLLTEAAPYTVGQASLVTSYEDAIDAIYAGYCPAVCSNQGFNDKRDLNGFLRAEGVWPHCMAVIGYDDTGPNPGILIINSWPPSWISGPTRHNQPAGSFWCRPEVFNRMVSRQPDSFVYSRLKGFPPRTKVINHAAL